jgi:hypothetical protein
MPGKFQKRIHGQDSVADVERAYNHWLTRMFKNRKLFIGALDEFYGAVATRSERFHKKRKAADHREATQFTVFDYIEPDENRLSDVIHDLLDPSGKHGQGTLFLNSFLGAIGAPHDATRSHCRVKREDCTLYCANFQRRIDITLDFSAFGIGIENKPWADEGDDQLKDYSLHLRHKFRQRFMLVYLSGDGSAPTSLSRAELAALKAAKQFKSLAYSTGLHHWLEQCCRECRADRVRLFLENFADYVKKGFELAEGDEGIAR